MKKIASFLLAFGMFWGSSSVSADFSDVPNSHLYHDAIQYVQAEGIVQGYSDRTYKPENQINRAEFLKIIVESRYERTDIDDCLGNTDTGAWNNVFFPDVPKSAWYAKYVCLGKVKEIIQGDKDGFFRPADNINFVEAAKIIVTAFRYAANLPDTSPWYQKYVGVLVEKKAIPLSIRSYSSFITRGEMAEIIYRLLEEITNKPSQSLLSLEEG